MLYWKGGSGRIARARMKAGWCKYSSGTRYFMATGDVLNKVGSLADKERKRDTSKSCMACFFRFFFFFIYLFLKKIRKVKRALLKGGLYPVVRLTEAPNDDVNKPLRFLLNTNIINSVHLALTHLYLIP